MIKINLLPADKRKNEFPTWKLYRICAYALLIVAVVLWGYHLAMFKYTSSRLTDVNATIASMQVWQERFDKAQAENAEINKRNTIVRNLSKDRVVWSRFLAELGNVTPYGCWLQSVQQSDKPEQLTLECKALKMDDVVKFIEVLQKRPDIADVQLVRATETKNNNNNIAVTDFTLNIVRSGVKK